MALQEAARRQLRQEAVLRQEAAGRRGLLRQEEALEELTQAGR